jgi:hypothetical protein
MDWSLQEAKRQGMPVGKHYCDYLLFLDADQVRLGHMPPGSNAYASVICYSHPAVTALALCVQHMGSDCRDATRESASKEKERGARLG